MDIKVPSNVSSEKEFVVEDKYLATFLGSGSVEVLSTPSMILFMEMVSRIMMDQVLPEGFTTVGTQVCIKHLSATTKGSKVIAKSALQQQTGKRLLFNVEVWCGDRKLGEGTHERAIIDKKNFKVRVTNKS